ncbi:hypothetical protein B590_30438 (plasmid) [Streptomyces sp. PVA_94-07]|uniref:hypothetical protein n=1 Tax=Streptomyces sp. PVA_94-07 TaxID=1225337 RepID=UPI0003C3099D|nr:hypothetical protein [Streptomyces sp. PVA_94-07]ESQ01791.1 hypothetical protein B590_30438 [Streptomyces sp. PVA_94-07]
MASRGDLSNTLQMLHTTIVSGSKDTKEEVAKGFDKVEAAIAVSQTETREAVNSELSKMRGNLRDVQNRLLANREELGDDVRRYLSAVQDEIRNLARTVEEARKTYATPAEAGLGAPAPAEPAPASMEIAPVGADAPVGAPATSESSAPEEAVAPSLENKLDTVLTQNTRLVGALDGIEARHEALTEAVAALTAQQATLAAHHEQALTQLTELRHVLDGQTTALAAVTTEAAPVSIEVSAEHAALLGRAARISSAVLLCHRDLWEFLTAQAGRHPHFRLPPELTDQGRQRIAAAISGRSLIAVLITLFELKQTAPKGDGNWSLADTLYTRIEEGLSSLKEGGTPVILALDDGVTTDVGPAEASSEEEPNASEDR